MATLTASRSTAHPLAATPAAPADFAALAQAAPLHPFFTPAYAEAHQQLGAEPWIFTVGEPGAPSTVQFPAFMRSGRLTRTIWFPSMPPALPASAWRELDRFLKRKRVADAAFDMFAPGGFARHPDEWPAMLAHDASHSRVAPQRGETERVRRIEFGIDLTRDDMAIWASITRDHRERIMKARKHGVSLQRSRDEAALERHLALHAASMERRQGRGEDVHSSIDRSEPAALLASGAGELFEVVHEGQVVSSYLIITSAQGMYSVSSGSSPVGMQIGGSHYLQYHASMTLRGEGIAAFFTGGVREHEQGLKAFKEGFGPVSFPSIKVLTDRTGPILRTVIKLLR